MNRAPCFLALGLCLAFSYQLSAEEILGRPFILHALEDAKRTVDEAYKYSRIESLSRVQKGSASPADILRLLKQPARDTRSAVRAADYMDYTLTLIQQRAHHLHKRSLNATDLLTPDELGTIARLTGCAARVRPPSCRTTPQINTYRTATSVCNNLKNPRRGASNTPFTRWLPPKYDDGISQPRGWDPKRSYNGFLLPLVREVSNRILTTVNKSVENDQVFTHLVTIFGQWNDHDLTFTPASPSIRSFSNGIDCDATCEQANPCFPIPIPKQDPRFGANSKTCLPFFRSAPACGTGSTGFIFGANNVLEQINSLTAYLDVGQVYGSEDVLARDLRDLTNDGGLLRVNQRFNDNGRELLPFTNMKPNMCATRQKVTNTSGLEEVPCFVAGDVRVDENIGLTSLHTVFLREHNRLARALRQLNPHWSSETLYQEARKIMGGYHQVLMFRDYLRHIVGPDELSRRLSTYPGYDENVDPTISNVFATAAYRFAHLAIQPFMFRLDENYNEHPQFPSVPLHKAFFTPWRVVFEGGADPLIRGLIGHPAKLNTQDHVMVEALRDRLFQFTSRLALDLGALNMQRSREHGIPGYNEWRRFCGLSEPQNVEQLAQVMNNTDLAQRLLQLYGTPANIDVWLGGVVEPFVPGGRVGPLFACLIAKQFQNIRQGDRLWWQNEGVFTSRQRASLASVSLARIICDNTGIRDVPRDPFLYRPRGSGYANCDTIPAFDLTPWIEADPDDNQSGISGFQGPTPSQALSAQGESQENEVPQA
ncbi:eosinophil peroxidase-like isoform X2 [Anguilla anguilla]|uniref:eosinophil peroxidase-like isoform X2 n=1 Tax=Anguilla anguilla TaxID=7936 RepID=UPI0015A9770B|nr:eosinophil peroxidase-like isoform X2 [Anguilla anguilla]